jgi:hypothetical protein
MALMRIFGTESEEVTGKRRILPDETLHDVHAP